MQAALNVLREQRRAMWDTHRQIAADWKLKAEDHAHWQRLYIQSNLEVHQLDQAIELIRGCMDGPPGLLLSPAGLSPREQSAVRQ